jgi:hypothetical protein
MAVDLLAFDGSSNGNLGTDGVHSSRNSCTDDSSIDTFSSNDEENIVRQLQLATAQAIQVHVLQSLKRRREIVSAVCKLNVSHYAKYMNKTPYRVPALSGYDWTIRTLDSKTQCYRMLRMHRNMFDNLHNLLLERYGLTPTRKMTSSEALTLFLWMCGGQQSMRQADNRFERSLETVSRKFDKVLECVVKLAADIIRPKDPEFRTMHQRLRSARFAPFFDNCIGAIDGTHVPVTVPTEKVVQYTGRKGFTTQNVLAICNFDMRFTFVVARWPGSVHDKRVFNDALEKYKDRFPFPP